MLDRTSVHVPSHMLTSYPSLAVYVNAILTTFNSLPVFISISDLEDVLTTSGEALLEFVRTVEDGFDGAEGDYSETETEKRGKESKVLVIRQASGVSVRVLVANLRRGVSEGVHGASLEAMDGEAGDGRKTGEKLKLVMVEWKSWLDGANGERE
ncbi:uncharacterized protein STEHIDRAFT_163784 [Stereum hirsutum FP-91666 SS1]|uniref:Uncharacterized protein n=1 Tax=Stereum hirsutum (strain FP-91666) TaxID=721885 RepID=R7RX86_STEHR|nr:uncharacterized protein STEHIDRAFT_163784 [Stereum hirsutum FP-91666 SS1]EIM79433.1 hypothetical protein STEHIDRAFT_163784 [Stereum hirsutum FP-91666 SS1]